MLEITSFVIYLLGMKNVSLSSIVFLLPYTRGRMHELMLVIGPLKMARFHLSQVMTDSARGVNQSRFVGHPKRKV